MLNNLYKLCTINIREKNKMADFEDQSGEMNPNYSYSDAQKKIQDRRDYDSELNRIEAKNHSQNIVFIKNMITRLENAVKNGKSTPDLLKNLNSWKNELTKEESNVQFFSKRISNK